MYESEWGSLAAAHSLQKAVFYTTSHMRICINTTSHARIRIRYYCMLQWNWRFVWWNHHRHSNKLYWKKNHSFCFAIDIFTRVAHL